MNAPQPLGATSETEVMAEGNILLVDDRPENLLALEAVLDDSGYNLVRASSGEEALRHLLNQEFAVILLDAQMPGMDGFETAQLIRTREKSRDIPIIFITAEFKGLEHMSQAYAHKAVDYILKPFDPEILRTKVAVLVDLYQKTAQVERQAIERRRIDLEASEARLRKIILGNADGIIVVDGNGMVQFINPAAEAMLGRKKEELLGEVFGFPVVPGESAELDIVRKGGGALIAEIRVVAMEWEGAGAYLASLRDITDRKRAQEVLARADKLRALAQTARGIAHEFNNVLVRIQGCADLALMGLGEDPDAVREDIEGVISGATDAARVVRRLQLLHRRADDLSDFVPLQLDALVSEALAWIRSHWQHDPFAEGDSLRVRTNLTAPPPVWGNPDELRRVLARFIGNAIQAMPTGGTLAIETGHDSTWSFVTVSDTDRGVRSEIKRDAFEPFFTTTSDTADELGMTTATSIIERHGGEISAESRPGIGTSFTLRLPTAEGFGGDGRD